MAELDATPVLFPANRLVTIVHGSGSRLVVIFDDHYLNDQNILMVCKHMSVKQPQLLLAH